MSANKSDNESNGRSYTGTPANNGPKSVFFDQAALVDLEQAEKNDIGVFSYCGSGDSFARFPRHSQSVQGRPSASAAIAIWSDSKIFKAATEHRLIVMDRKQEYLNFLSNEASGLDDTPSEQ